MIERQNYLAEGFRNVDRQRDVEKFKACLTFMETLSCFRTYKEETYRLLEPERGSLFLDVGCGLGFDAERLAQRTPARIVGLDASYELLQDARARAQDRGITNADYIAADGLLQCFGEGQFDGARVDRTLQHLERPALVIENMARVVRKGGRIVCAEPDWGTFFIDDDDARSLNAVSSQWTSSIRNPFIGRELPRLLRSAGLKSIQASGYLLATYGLKEVNLIFDVQKTSDILAERDCGETFKDWYRKLASRDLTSPVFAGVTVVIAAGFKE